MNIVVKYVTHRNIIFNVRVVFDFSLFLKMKKISRQ